MNILFVTIAWPENGTNLYTDLIHEFRDNGHKLTVICNRERRVKKNDSFKMEAGVNVLRLNSGNIKKAGILEKGISLLRLGWTFKRGIKRYLNEYKFDLILFNTPPVTLSGFLEYLKLKYDCPVYLLLKDMWPYGFADFGIVKRNGFVYNYILKHENKVFQLCDRIGCMSKKGSEFVLGNYPEIDREKVEICPNSIRISPSTESNKSNIDEIKSQYGIPSGATVFIFSGNLGLGHGLEFLVESILKLKNYRNAYFLIGGAGTFFSKIKKIMDVEKPPNAYMYSYLPDDEFYKLMSICDVGLILLHSKYSYPQFPSRLLGYLRAKMAVLCSVNAETDIGDIIENNGAGLKTLHGDSDSFIKSVKKLSEDRYLLNEMGKNGYRLLENEYDVRNSYEIIMRHYK